MKKIIIAGVALLIGIGAFIACSPQEDNSDKLGTIIAAQDIKMSVTQDASDKNLYHFQLTTPQCLGVFSCPAAGINKSGVTDFSQRIAWANDYTMAVQVYNPGGLSEAIQIPFSVETTDPTICENELYKFLTGGCDAPDGKTWRINSSVSGAIGCGEKDASSNNWWAPSAADLKPELFDDDMTFFLDPEQHFTLDNKGASFMNESTASLFPDGKSTDSFVTTNYKASDKASWSIVNEGGANWLVITNGFPAYAVNPAAVTGGKYKIISLTATELHIAYIPGDISWHYLLTSTPR